MKRSATVRRVLLGGVSAGALAAFAAAAESRITAESYYPNDHYIGGAGYYHAPFRGFFPRPYNDYDPVQKLYFFGGQWGPAPHRSIVNLSAPLPDAARLAESARTDLPRNTYIQRSGFGGTSGSHFLHS